MLSPVSWTIYHISDALLPFGHIFWFSYCHVLLFPCYIKLGFSLPHSHLILLFSILKEYVCFSPLFCVLLEVRDYIICLCILSIILGREVGMNEWNAYFIVAGWAYPLKKLANIISQYVQNENPLLLKS